MRKIIVLSMISLDGVMQAPGGPQEDTSGGFEFGGWTAPFSDEIGNNAVRSELYPADYILGRKTFEIWENYWPEHSEFWPEINSGTKYVVSKIRNSSDWENSEFLADLSELEKIKNQDGRDIHIWGSSEIVQQLLKSDLVDEIRLKIHPVILGKGKRLFDDQSAPASFELTESTVTTTGVILANYKRSGEVKTGNAGE